MLAYGTVPQERGLMGHKIPWAIRSFSWDTVSYRRCQKIMTNLLIIKVFKMSKKDSNWPKKALRPKLFLLYSPLHSKISQEFQISKKKIGPSTKNWGEVNFLGNFAHLSFASLHIPHLFPARTLFVLPFLIWATVFQSFLIWNAHAVFYQANTVIVTKKGRMSS